MLFTVVDGDREVGRKLLVLLERNELVGDDPLGLASLAPRAQAQHAARTRGPEGVRRGLRAAAAARRGRRGRHRRGVVRGGRSSRLAHDLRRCTRALRDAERMPSADEIVVEWPEDAFAQVAPDRDTAVVVLTHDDKFDIPALATALRTEAFYVGALGSRRAQAKRRERLLESGLTEAQLARLRGPAGLDIGAETPGRDGRLDSRRGARGPRRSARRRASGVADPHPRRALDELPRRLLRSSPGSSHDEQRS